MKSLLLVVLVVPPVPVLALVVLDTWPRIEHTSAEKIVKLSTM